MCVAFSFPPHSPFVSNIFCLPSRFPGLCEEIRSASLILIVWVCGWYYRSALFLIRDKKSVRFLQEETMYSSSLLHVGLCMALGFKFVAGMCVPNLYRGIFS